jgi:glycosyltransferase involved in cell wall biosynthesis
VTEHELTRGAVSVVIPTCGRPHLLEAVIRPLLDDIATAEVIVVVDGCRDGTYERLRTAARVEPRLRAIWQDKAGGPAARGRGAACARADIILFLDDDVIPDPGLVSKHVAMHGGGTPVVVVGYMPTVLPDRRRPGHVATYLYASDYERVCAAYERDERQILLNLWAGNFSLPRAEALRVGMVGPGELERHADKQLGYRCLAAGLRARFSRELSARHHHRRTNAQFLTEARRQARARRWFATHHPELEGESWLRARSAALLGPAFLLLAHPRIVRLSSALIFAAIEAAGRMRLWRLETGAARLLRQVIWQSPTSAAPPDREGSA